jgi:putative cardiolipin synthase
MKRILTLFVAPLLALALASGCATLPSLEGRTVTTALADTAGTRLGRAVAAQVAANPGMTGIHSLAEPRDAFAARAVFAAAADRSLDVQYYIWHGDQVGYLLLEALWRAAERGVRVRLLLDDMNTGGLDPTIAALDEHPNIEVRLYNPFAQRTARWTAFLTDFSRLNRRMHNKSFTVDNQVSIVGGRNIGNEYFGAGSDIAFADLDVIAVGAAVPAVSSQFDLYWNSPSAYPVASLVRSPGQEARADLEARFTSVRADPESNAYMQAVASTPLVRDLLDGRLRLEWVPARVVHDDPAKTLDTTDRKDVLLFPQLMRIAGPSQATFDLISPYFVPGEEGSASLARLAHSGVKIRILTNSLASSEASVVFSGYAKRRKELLQAGVQLYEMRPTEEQEEQEDRARKAGVGSSGASALHAKTFSVDHVRSFVGSFNFDKRSELLNTEMGLVIESPLIAQRFAEFFDNVVPTSAYEVRLKSDGSSMEWIERTATGEVRYDADPGTSALKRLGVEVLSLFPIDWML